jgi:hypothetical protein
MRVSDLKRNIPGKSYGFRGKGEKGGEMGRGARL